MRVLVQRTGKASVKVSNKDVGKIDHGLVLLVGFTDGDDIGKIEYLAKKVVNLRIFPDDNGVMNSVAPLKSKYNSYLHCTLIGCTVLVDEDFV